MIDQKTKEEIISIKNKLLQSREENLKLQNSNAPSYKWGMFFDKEKSLINQLSELNKFYDLSLKDLFTIYIKVHQYKCGEELNFSRFCNAVDKCPKTIKLFDDVNSWQLNKDNESVVKEICDNNADLIKFNMDKFEELYEKAKALTAKSTGTIFEMADIMSDYDTIAMWNRITTVNSVEEIDPLREDHLQKYL